MLLERNGMAYITNQTKHLMVIYWFIKDCISSGDLVVKYCPTREILSEHFTKPLQGALFQKYRVEIQGIPTNMTDKDMWWVSLWIFNIAPKASITATRNPIPQEYVGEYLNYYLSSGSSWITGNEKLLDNKYCIGMSSFTLCNGPENLVLYK